MFENNSATKNPLSRFVDASIAFLLVSYLRWSTLFGVLVFVLYVSIVLLVSMVQPKTDWDALPYVAVAAERLYDTPAALHAYAYEVVKNNVKPAVFTTLTQDDGYRTEMYKNADGFVSMLGMYRVKWLYVTLLEVLVTKTDPMQAIRWVSAVSAMIFAGVSLTWLKSERALALTPVFVAILIISGFADMARLLSPDMMFAALLLAGVYAHLRRIEILSAALLFSAFLVRPDNIVFLGVFSTVLVIYRQWSWGVILAFVCACLTIFPLSISAGQPSWWAHFYFSAVGTRSSMEDFHPAFSIGTYLWAVSKQFALAITSQGWMGVLLIGLAAFTLSDRLGMPFGKQKRALIIAVILSIIFKFLLFPLFETRIYFAYIILIFLAMAEPVSNVFGRYFAKPYKSNK